MELNDLITRLALENALKFKGTANPKALIGGVIREFPDAKKDMKTVQQLISEITSEINLLSLDDQKQRLLELDPDFESKKQEQKLARKEKANELPEISGAVFGKFVTRMPPEPSKYNHIGHAMSFLINYLYAKKYGGRVILRLDDTNPEKESLEFAEAMEEDVINYLGLVPDEIIYASDHMDKYYSYADKLISEGRAYACSCKKEDISAGRRSMVDCPHRNQSVEETRKLFEEMKNGLPEAGSITLRLKIDMKHKNAVMRDPVIYRLSYNSHYRQGEKFKVWPMYDFECAIEEGLCGVTHVFRSNEFDSRIELQNYIAGLFGFPEVVYKHYGRYNVVGATTQGREIKALIDTGNYIGWDDPRLVTLRALKRRGIVKESYVALAKKIGFSKQQTNLDYSVIAAINRSILDVSAKRFFAVRNHVKISVDGIPDSLTEFSLSFHPDAKKGDRKLSVSKEYYVESEDNSSTHVGSVIRLMDAMNIKKVSENSYVFVSESYEDFVKIKSDSKIIHFVPVDGSEMNAEMLMPDTSIVPLICESNVGLLKPDSVIQFERYCFARFDHIKSDGVIQFWYTHD